MNNVVGLTVWLEKYYSGKFNDIFSTTRTYWLSEFSDPEPVNYPGTHMCIAPLPQGNQIH